MKTNKQIPTKIVLACIGCIVILTIALYGPVFEADFCGFDDQLYVTQNDWVRAGLTPDGIYWAFSRFHSSNWHPLTWISHMIDCEVYGMNAAGHHASNVILHIMNSILLFVFFSKATGHWFRSFALSLLFAIHPLHVESVAWIAERKDVLSTFFGLFCLLAYYAYIQNFEKKFYYLMILCLCMSLMSKSMLVTMPFLLIILDIWPLKRTDANRFKDKLPLLIPVGVSGLVTYFAQLSGKSVNLLSVVPLSDRIMNANISIINYIWKTIWPVKLSVLYPYPDPIHFGFAIFCFCLVLIIFFTGLYLYSQMPFLFTGYLWFLIALLPVIGIIQIGTQAMADRYTYIPHIGLFWAIIWTASEWVQKSFHKKIMIVVFCLSIIGFACRTYDQTKFWKNGETLFRQAITNTHNNYIAHNNLGACLKAPKESLAEFNKSIAINPNYILGRLNRGKCLFTMDKIHEAILAFKEILDQKPHHSKANIALAEIYRQKQEWKKAIHYYQSALINADDCGPIYFQIAQIFQKIGQLKDAQNFYSQALSVHPLSPVIHYEYGHILVSSKQFIEAIDHFKRAIELKPDFAKAYNSLGALYAWNNQLNKAFEYIAIARRLAPEDDTIVENYTKIREKISGEK